MRNGAKVNEVTILSFLVSAEECPLEKFSKSLLEHKVNILNFINNSTSSCAVPVEKFFSNGDWEGALSLWCFSAIPGKGEMLMEHTGLHPLGIQHVVECLALVPWLEKWSSSNDGVEKEEAEQRFVRRHSESDLHSCLNNGGGEEGGVEEERKGMEERGD